VNRTCRQGDLAGLLSTANVPVVAILTRLLVVHLAESLLKLSKNIFDLIYNLSKPDRRLVVPETFVTLMFPLFLPSSCDWRKSFWSGL
jgi:hypothetical protein